LLERLRRLEGVVKGLGVTDLEVLALQSGEDGGKEQGQQLLEAEQAGAARGQVTGETTDADTSFNGNEKSTQSRTKHIDENPAAGIENRFGRLVMNEGKSRYVSSSFWANLSNEVEDLKGLLNQSSDEEDDDLESTSALSQQHEPSNHHGFIFGASSHNVDLLSLHPQPGQIKLYWEIFKDRVDPLVKVLHIPTTESTIIAASSSLTTLPRGFECLLFAIYYCAATSLSGRDCLNQLGEDRTILLTRYRFGIEQALARANFLTTEEVAVLQAFVLFLICLRRNNDARVIWTLTGLVVRIAQTIGIHRDGSHFGLTPFEIEMRRRLWWQVCVLDVRASEDHGCDPTILEQSYDTKMPLNINDEDMSPEMQEHPPDKLGCTDMSFCLLRFEIGNYFRRINYVPPGPAKPGGDSCASMTLAEKEKWIAECHKKIEEKYLTHCDMSKPLNWVVATVARLMMSKMWLMVYHPFQRQNRGTTLSKETREKLFITSIENMEYSLMLETEARTMKWNWLFRTYVQWHALAFTLSELCHRTTGEMVERAWTAVEKTRDARWGSEVPEDTNSSQLWRPLKRIYRKAREVHQRGQQDTMPKQVRAAAQPMRTYSPNPNPMFGPASRPRITRAPLSQAQLQRFSDGPPSTPRDPTINTELPLTSQFDPMTTQYTSSAYLPAQSTPSTLQQNPLTQTYLTSNPQVGATNLQQPNNFFSQTSPPTAAAPSTFYPGFPSNPAPSLVMPNQIPSFLQPQLGQMPGSYNTNAGSAAAVPEPGTPEFDFMDTSGDVDWANWEQLVRQYGMDIGAGNADVAGGAGGGGGSGAIGGAGGGGPEIAGSWNGRLGSW
jgi:hypothetical protein